MSAVRHYFPGNNTPGGFFSYYHNITAPGETEKVICIKGGPGTGKSTFMKKIGQMFLDAGEDVDFLHCSADENSLDGIILRNRKIAVIDGTSPHTADPVAPGASGIILNLGENWDEEGIAGSKDEIIALGEKSSQWYRIAYNYLKAAGSLFKSLEEVYNKAACTGEIYAVAADVTAKELGRYPVSMQPGSRKKFFASAITAGGTVNYIDSLVKEIRNIYIINAPEGYHNTAFMETITEGVLCRGFDAEIFCCPMSPDKKTDHIIIPQLSLGFITANSYHDIEPWELIADETEEQEITLIDIHDYMNRQVLEENLELISSLREEYDILLGKAIAALEKAKEAHMQVEELYIPHMNFTKVNALIQEIFEKLSE